MDAERDTADPELSPAERVLRRRLDGLEGRPLSARARQTQRSVEAYLRAGSPPRWMERVAEIDERIARERRALARAHAALRAQLGDDPERFARRWRAHVAAQDWSELNALIRQHNEWYPVERDLPVDPRTGEFVPIHGRAHHRPLLDADWALAEFPPRP